MHSGRRLALPLLHEGAVSHGRKAVVILGAHPTGWVWGGEGDVVNQRGFANLTLYAAIGAGVAILGLTIALKVQTARLDAVKDEYERFKGVTEAIGKIYKDKAKAKEAEYKAITKRTDDAHKKDTAYLRTDADRLRQQLNSGSGGLSGIPANPQRPDLACFERSQLDSAIRQYQSDLLGIAQKGAQATLDLDTAKSWVRGLK